MDLAEARFRLEVGHTVVFGNPGGKSETGEEYVCLCSGGEKRQGESMPALYHTADLACREWLRVAKEYAAEKQGTLYWRDPPELHTIECGGDERWAVYSRLLISDKPVLDAVA